MNIGAVRSIDRLRLDEVSALSHTPDHARQAACSEATSSLCASHGGGRPTLDTVIKLWHEEMHGTFNKAVALRIVRRLDQLQARPGFNSRDELEKLLQDWQSIPPALSQTTEGAAGAWPGWDELSQSLPGILASQLSPSWLAPAASDVATAVADIVSTLTQRGWVPRLDRHISQAPCFQDIRNEYADVSEKLQRALTEFIAVRAEMLAAVQEGKSGKDTIEQYQATHETLTRYIGTAAQARGAHRQAAGMARRHLEDNRASIAVKIVRAGAATAGASFLWPLFEGAQMMARNSDRARANQVIDELNMRFADLLKEGCGAKAASQLEEADIDPCKLRNKWIGQIESRLERVAEALHYEAKQESNEETRRFLLLQRDLVMKGDLGGLEQKSRAAELLVNDGELFRAALKARLFGDGAVARLSKAYCTRGLGMVSEEISSALLDEVCDGQPLDVAAAAAVAAQTSCAVGSGTMARHAEPPAAHSEPRHVSTLSYLGRVAKVGTGLCENVTAAARTIPQMLYNARDGIHGAQQGSAIDGNLTQASKILAEGITGACVGAVMTAAKAKGGAAQRSLDAMMPLLRGLKGKGDDWHKNRFRDENLQIKTYIPDANVASVKEAEQDNDTVLLLLKTGETNLVFFKGVNRGSNDAWYRIDDDGLNLRRVPVKPFSEFMKGLQGTAVEVLVASRALSGEGTDRTKRYQGKGCHSPLGSLRLRAGIYRP